MTQPVSPLFILKIDLLAHHEPRWEPFLTAFELVRNITTRLTLTVTNLSESRFPGGSLVQRVAEHGPGPNAQPLRWSLKNPLNIPPLSPSESWKTEVPASPVINGLFVVELEISSVNGEELPSPTVELRGFRSPGSSEVEFFFYTVPRETLELHESILKQRQEGGPHEHNR